MCCTLLLSIVVASRYCGVLVAFACCVHTQSDHEAGREDRVTRGLGIDEIEIETVGLVSVIFFSEEPRRGKVSAPREGTREGRDAAANALPASPSAGCTRPRRHRGPAGGPMGPLRGPRRARAYAAVPACAPRRITPLRLFTTPTLHHSDSSALTRHHALPLQPSVIAEGGPWAHRCLWLPCVCVCAEVLPPATAALGHNGPNARRGI